MSPQTGHASRVVTFGKELSIHVPALKPGTVLPLHRLFIQRGKVETSVGRSGECERLACTVVTRREGTLTDETNHVDAGN